MKTVLFILGGAVLYALLLYYTCLFLAGEINRKKKGKKSKKSQIQPF